MSGKVLARVLVLILLLLAFFGIPASAQAGGMCGGTYVVEFRDTPDTIAAMCGITVSAIYAANPGVSGALSVGQVLTLPGSNYTVPPTTPTVTPIATNIINNYNTYNYNYNYVPSNYNGNYIVQAGDTFSGIASRHGVGIYDLWTANPHIWDINLLYAGQVIYVPTSSGQTIYAPTYTTWAAPTETPVPLSYGTVPDGTPYGAIKLVNKSSGEIYVSLQGTTRDGINVINEYPVTRTMKAKVPVGWYSYVAWVNGQQFQGQFNLNKEVDHTITFYNDKTVVE
jgi:LysM repeat protein